MKFQNKLLLSVLLAGLAAVAAPGAARADESHRQVWYDSEGVVVENSWGNCVRSRWSEDHDPCGRTEPHAWVAPQHTNIAEEDRTVYFAFNKAELTPEGKQRLNSLAQRLTSADDITGAKIVGYADRIGTTSYNEKLSKKRAETVRNYLATHGLIKPTSTDVRWVGKSEPTANCSGKQPHAKLVECLQPDRKVQVEIQYKEMTQSSAE